MIVQKSCHSRDPGHDVLIPSTASLQLRLEVDFQPKSHAQFERPNIPAAKTQKAIVICGFAAIGKSTFKSACEEVYDGVRVIDLDSSLFPKGPTWPDNYLEAIRERLSERCILMISTHKAIYSQLLEEGVKLILVYPKRELRTEWLERIRRREAYAGTGQAESICRVVDDRWDQWIEEYGEMRGCLQHQMSEGEYLQGAVDEVVRHFHTGVWSATRGECEEAEDAYAS